VRATGSVRLPVGLALGDHLSWPYDDDDAFADTALRYLADGLLLGERILCVGDEQLHASLQRLDPENVSISGTSGPALVLRSLEEAYGLAKPRTPVEQLTYYRAAVDSALSAGYTGLRVLAEVTALIADPRRSAAHLSWEQRADAALASGVAMTALCAYRGDLLDAESVAELSCVHPLVRGPEAAGSFRLFHEHNRLVLAGTITATAASRLRRVLHSEPVPANSAPGGRASPSGRHITLDLHQAAHVDPLASRVLADWVATMAAREVKVEVTGGR
jgi:hypothetical protein